MQKPWASQQKFERSIAAEGLSRLYSQCRLGLQEVQQKSPLHVNEGKMSSVCKLCQATSPEYYKPERKRSADLVKWSTVLHPSLMPSQSKSEEGSGVHCVPNLVVEKPMLRSVLLSQKVQGTANLQSCDASPAESEWTC